MIFFPVSWLSFSLSLTEIIKEAKNNGDKLTELLYSNTDQLEPNCLDRAMMVATQNDNHFNIGKLVVKGAKNLEECLEYTPSETTNLTHVPCSC